MTPYAARLEEDINRISRRVVDAAEQVDRALKDSTQALLTADLELGYTTVLGDHAINRHVRETDWLCHAFMVRHLPSARHLRMVSAVQRIERELERIGDYAATIGRQTAQLQTPPPKTVARHIEVLSDQGRRMLRQAIRAFQEQNAELARGTMAIEKQIDAAFEHQISDLAEQAGEYSPRELFGWLVVLNRLERVSDRAQNICDEIVFWVTGERKPPNLFRILFVGRHNTCVSQMAEAIARKAFPDSGRYASAGLDPASKLNDHVVSYMEKLGVDLSKHRPRGLEVRHSILAEYHMVIGLGLDPAEYIPDPPFHTVLLAWEGIDCPASEEQCEAEYRKIANKIADLMEILHGPDAS